MQMRSLALCPPRCHLFCYAWSYSCANIDEGLVKAWLESSDLCGDPGVVPEFRDSKIRCFDGIVHINERANSEAGPRHETWFE